jgi:hypothetical protein
LQDHKQDLAYEVVLAVYRSAAIKWTFGMMIVNLIMQVLAMPQIKKVKYSGSDDSPFMHSKVEALVAAILAFLGKVTCDCNPLGSIICQTVKCWRHRSCFLIKFISMSSSLCRKTEENLPEPSYLYWFSYSKLT